MLKLILSAAAVILSVQAVPAFADWRQDLGAYRVGILAQGNSAKAVARAEPFRLALEVALSMPVEIVPARDYPALIDSIAAKRIEHARLSAIAYAAAYNLCECIEPLAIARSDDGSAGFRAIILVRPGGPSSESGLEGRTLGIVGNDRPGAAALALYELRKQGIEADIREFAKGEEAATAFLQGDIDGLLGWEPENARSEPRRGTLAHLENRGAAGLRTIWRSSIIPHHTHAVRTDMDTEAKGLLRQLLLSLHSDDPIAYDLLEPVQGGGYQAADPAQFTPVQEMLAARDIIADKGAGDE